MTRADIIREVLRLVGGLGVDTSRQTKAQQEVYVAELERNFGAIPLDRFQDAVSYLVDNADYPRLPLAGEIRAAIAKVSPPVCKNCNGDTVIPLDTKVVGGRTVVLTTRPCTSCVDGRAATPEEHARAAEAAKLAGRLFTDVGIAARARKKKLEDGR